MERPQLNEFIQDTTRLWGAWILGAAIAGSGVIGPVPMETLHPRPVSPFEAFIPEELDYIPDDKPQKLK